MKMVWQHVRWICHLDSYYVKELKAPAGFVSSDEVLNLMLLIRDRMCRQ